MEVSSVPTDVIGSLDRQRHYSLHLSGSSYGLQADSCAINTMDTLL